MAQKQKVGNWMCVMLKDTASGKYHNALAVQCLSALRRALCFAMKGNEEGDGRERALHFFSCNIVMVI
jgi:hypothetical protein